jgi:Ca-activated chloride channel family protein
MDEARKLFVENLTGTLQLIARDAKIQVEFDPNVVERYRLVGYENRDVADQDFRNDAVDAGEVGAGHSVTALYEIKRFEDARSAAAPLATVRIRYYKIGGGRQVVEEQQAIGPESVRRSFREATPRFRLAVSVAQYAELLRYSRWARGVALDDVVQTARDAARDFESAADVEEFVGLLDRAAALAPED